MILKSINSKKDNTNQRTIGITGGIGSGKSTIAKIIAVLGYPIYVADTRAKELMTEDSALIEQVKLVFGEEIYSNSSLNRQLLASIVFNDKSKLAQLNALVHPAVNRDFTKWCSLQNSSILFKEAAILFETNIYKQLDATILVIASEEERISRVMKRDACSREEVLARMKNQWSQEQKIALADYIINNEGNELIIPQVISIIHQLTT